MKRLTMSSHKSYTFGLDVVLWVFFVFSISSLVHVSNLIPAFAAQSPNLIPNPSVEIVSPTNSGLPLSWMKGGWGTNTRTLTYPVAGFDGLSAIKTEISSRTSGDAKWYFEPIPVSGGEEYTYKDDYQSTTGSYVTLQYQLADGTYKYPDIAISLPPAPTTTTISRTFVVPTNYPSPVVRLSVFHLINSVGSLTIDNVSLTRTTSEQDTTPPTVSVTAPANPLSGTVTISVNATDNIGVAGVQYFLDNIPLFSEITTPPFTKQWDTSGVSNGIHLLKATAHDAAGNSAVSESLSVQIDNSVTPPPPPSTESITVNVTVVNDNDGSKSANDFVVYVDTLLVDNGKATELSPGVHTVSELSDPSYTFTIGGDCDASGKITLASNQHAVCTIINNDVPPTPPVTQVNFIPNPSVETASPSNSGLPTSWAKGGWGTNTRTLTYPVAGVDGNRAVKTEITSRTSGDAKWYFASIPVKGGQRYEFSDQFKASTESTITVQYQLADGTYKYTDLVIGLPASPTWVTVTRNFTVPTNFASPVISLSVFHLINSVGWVITDNHILATFVPPPLDPNNAILNPSLEVVSNLMPTIPEGWARGTSAGSVASYLYPVAGYDGVAAAKVTISQYTAGAGAKWYPVAIDVTPGDEYIFSDAYQSDTDSIISLEFLLDNGGRDYLDLMRLAPSPGWSTSENKFVVPAHAISLTIEHLIKSTGQLTIDNYVLKKLPSGKFSAGMVTLNFDDGPISIFQNALPLLDAANIKSTQYIVSEAIDWSDYMNLAQIQTLASGGHEIGGHTRTHPHLTTLSRTELTVEIAGGKADLEVLGFTPQTFSYPFGEFNDLVREEVIAAGYIGARSVRSGFNTKHTDPFDLVDQHVEVNTTVATITGWIDKAIADRTWLILELHDINLSGDTYSATPATLSAVLDYINERGIDVVPMTVGLTRMKQ